MSKSRDRRDALRRSLATALGHAAHWIGNLAVTAIIIGAVSVSMSLAGMELGNRIGARTGERGELIGGRKTAVRARPSEWQL